MKLVSGLSKLQTDSYYLDTEENCVYVMTGKESRKINGQEFMKDDRLFRDHSLRRMLRRMPQKGGRQVPRLHGGGRARTGMGGVRQV
jgi:hypothetical protein